jgi:hypothetical protein
MANISSFKRPAVTAKPAAKAAPRRARYGGIQASAPRDPMPTEGVYDFIVEDFAEGELVQGKDTQSVRLTMTVASSDGENALPVDSRAFVPFRVAGAGATAGKSRMKAFIVAAAGYDSDDAYSSWDTDGFGIDAMLGYDAPEPFAGKTLVGRHVICEVTRGKAIIDKDTGKPTGEYYMNYTWAPAEDPIA